MQVISEQFKRSSRERRITVGSFLNSSALAFACDPDESYLGQCRPRSAIETFTVMKEYFFSLIILFRLSSVYVSTFRDVVCVQLNQPKHQSGLKLYEAKQKV